MTTKWNRACDKALLAATYTRGITCPSAKKLMEIFRDVTKEKANLLRMLCKLADEPDRFREYVEGPGAAYLPDILIQLAQWHSHPWGRESTRREIVMMAADEIIDGYGVEALGPDPYGPKAPPYTYVNMGDTYSATLIYERKGDRIFVGSWGDVVEKHPSWLG